jgi:hypothetical protein
MSECMPCDANEKSKPTSRVCVSKEEAMKMKVDSEVSMHMTGKVISLQPSWDDKSMYEVTIEEPKVEVKSSDEEKKEDDNYATMPREKLKEKIKKPEEKDEE